MANNRKKLGNAPHAPVDITLRTNQGKRMHAAFFDHYLTRKITDHLTTVSKSANQDETSFINFIKSADHTFTLGMGSQIGNRVTPAVIAGLNSAGGLLFIPGRSKDDIDDIRKNHEEAVIKDALLRGRPILAVCAGSWRLWESLGGKLISVDDHCYSGMPYILSNGDAGNNVAIHRVALTSHSLVDDCMKIKGDTKVVKYPTVNSVHWMAPDPSTCPEKVIVSAKARADASMVVKKRCGNAMAPTDNSIEAFERYGSPTVGVLWHLEAYYQKNPDKENKRHLNIVRYMAKAGDAYQAKQKMLTEYKSMVAPLLNKFGTFKKAVTNKQELEDSPKLVKKI